MWARRMAVVAASLLLGSTAHAGVVEANLEVVGRWDLGAPAAYGEVVVAGTTAVVASGVCGGSAAVVDLGTPRRPRLAASIAAPEGMTFADLDAAFLATPAFSGDLLAVALAPCSGTGAGWVALYDISAPAAPRALARLPAAGTVALAQRADGRALAVRATGAGVEVDDVSDPAAPGALGGWPSPPAECGPAGLALYDEGERAVVALAGGVYDIDLIDPTRPSAVGPATGAGGHAGVLPLGNRTIAIVAADGGGGCSPTEPLLRVLRLRAGETPVDEPPVRYPGAGAPGRLAASGAYAYVAWASAGLRVVDFAEVRARTVAQFAPVTPDVVGVALMAEYVVVTDAGAGLFVLARPDEGGGQPTFWTQFLDLLPYLGGAAVLTALALLPRIAGGRGSAPVPVPSPGAEPVRRQRA